jgi:hypothetical protein
LVIPSYRQRVSPISQYEQDEIDPIKKVEQEISIFLNQVGSRKGSHSLARGG